MNTLLSGMLSRDGKTISNGCLFTWITFTMCLVYWVWGLFDPSIQVPGSLQSTFEVCLIYMFGGTALYSGRNIGSKYIDKRYTTYPTQRNPAQNSNIDTSNSHGLDLERNRYAKEE